MNAPRFWMVVPALLVAGVVGMAYAKLPPMSDEAKAKAVVANATKAEAKKKAGVALEKARARALENYRRGKGGK